MLAADYVLLGRLVRHLGMDRYLRIPARRTTKIFVLSDVTTFLIRPSDPFLCCPPPLPVSLIPCSHARWGPC